CAEIPIALNSQCRTVEKSWFRQLGLTCFWKSANWLLRATASTSLLSLGENPSNPMWLLFEGSASVASANGTTIMTSELSLDDLDQVSGGQFRRQPFNPNPLWGA